MGENKAMIFPTLMKDSVKLWIRLKNGETETKLECKTHNLPIHGIIKESVQRFEEVIGARPEMIARSLFSRGNDDT